MKCETVLIVSDNEYGCVRINKEDFDEDIHELYESNDDDAENSDDDETGAGLTPHDWDLYEDMTTDEKKQYLFQRLMKADIDTDLRVSSALAKLEEECESNGLFDSDDD